MHAAPIVSLRAPWPQTHVFRELISLRAMCSARRAIIAYKSIS
ncbi:hypothetical protein ARTHRO8AJ_40175 [Arthrobacter sp. 8AJ]|nr:hypothetical protein ARTHRO8AJ_40175 [Arthrobacter sp. 8AJ]